MLSPPVIVEALSVCSTSIRLKGQLRSARVEVFVDGNPTAIVDVSADWPDQWFAFRPGTTLSPGQLVRARQSKDGDTSPLSTEPASVQDRSTTQPLFVPPLVGCSSIAVIEGMAPGAGVHVRDSSAAALADTVSPGTRAVVTLSRPLGNGETLTAFTDACGAPAGAAVSSLPSEPMRGSLPKLKVPTLTQAMECQRILVFGNTRVGAVLKLRRTSGVVFWTCSADELHARIDPPLVKDEDLDFWQEPPQPRCEVDPSDEGHLRVAGGPPGPPRITTRPCPGSRWIKVADLVPTATVKILADGVDVCVFEAAESTQDVDLGSVALVPGQKLTVVQGLCGVFGPPSPVPSWVTKPALSAAPSMPERLVQCGTVVRVAGLAGATRVSVFSDRLKGRIGFAFAESGSIDVAVSPPLIAGDRIYANATGCAGGSAAREVEPIRDLPPFELVDPEGEDASVLVRKLLPGCRVDVTVNGQWSGGGSSGGTECRVGLSEPLHEGETVQVFVRMCSQMRTMDPVTVKAPLVIAWSRPTTQALLMNTGHYMSGRVQAAIPLATGLLLGMEEGGLWLASSGGTALPLSFDWHNSLIRSLARGTRGDQHIYCGTTNGLMESETAIPIPVLLWRTVNGVPSTAPGTGPGAVVNDILVLASKNLVFIATNVGLWWSPIPATSGTGYVWSSDAAVNQANVLSLCQGPADSIVAYGQGPMGNGFVRGEWSGAALQWSNVTPGVGIGVADPRLVTVVQRMANGRVASCAADRSRVVAALEDGTDNAWLAVLRSDDGGKTWRIPYVDASLTFFKPGGTIDMGYQAERNLCIVVHALDKRRILLAGRRSGLLGSSDDGVTWNAGDWPAVSDGSFHADCICLVPDAADPSGNRVIVGSDGGAFISTDFGKTWDASTNRTLTTLMFDQQGWSSAPALSASEQFPGLLVGAFQDNGKAYLLGDGEPWRELGSVGDGQRALFVTGDIVLNGGNDDVDLKWARWDGTKFVDEVTLEPPDYPANTSFMPFMARIPYPTYTDAAGGAPMIAIAGDNQPSRNVFGLFDRGAGHSPASERLYWRLLGTVPFAITAIGSLSGTLIVVGTSSARTYLLDPATGTVSEMTMPSSVTSGAVRWVTLADDSVAFALVGNTLLRTTDMASWSALAGLPANSSFHVIAVDRAPDPVRLILGGSDGVWSSRDLGATWIQATGLPAHPHANHLEVVQYSSGQRVAHLGTWNLSVWRAGLN